MNQRAWDNLRNKLIKQIEETIGETDCSYPPGATETMVLQILEHYASKMELGKMLGITNGIIANWVQNNTDQPTEYSKR